MFKVKRHPFLYVLTLIVTFGVHVWLCYPAATCVACSKVKPIQRLVAIYFAFLGVGLAPAFDDFEDFPLLRNVLLGIFAIPACLVLALALTNLTPPSFWLVPTSIIYFIFSTAMTLPFVVCFESMGRAFWKLFRRFPNEPE